MKVSIHINSQHLSQMVSQISRTYDFDRKFMEKRCGLSASLYGKSDMKRNYPDVDHQFDVWHLAKSVTKKLTEKAKKKDCGDLFPWIKSVSNHLWWCADTCTANKELLREKWISIVHHTANIHQWDSADLYHECPHPPIPRDVARTKRWLRPGSPAHEALKEVVFDKNLLKDIQQLTPNCHTGSLEVYHSVQTKYLPKSQHFWYKYTFGCLITASSA